MTRALQGLLVGGLAVLLGACHGARPAGVAVHVATGDDGLTTIVIEGDRPLRALLLDVEWDTPGEVTFTLGADGARLNLLRAAPTSDTSARVVLTDTRRLRLPEHGVILRASGVVRIVAAEGADDGPDGPIAVPVELE